MSVEHGSKQVEELSLGKLIDCLDMGVKEVKGDKLFLAPQIGTVFGQVEFKINGTKITGPDGTEFDLANMKYGGDDGIYAYLEKQIKGGGDEDVEEDLN